MGSELSGDKKYYASGQTSAINIDPSPDTKTKKIVVKKPVAANGVESSNKYYANSGGYETEEVPFPIQNVTGETGSISDVSDISRIIADVVELFTAGAAQVRLPVISSLETKTRTNLELRVGREELTSDQAANVIFVLLDNPEPVEEEEEEMAPANADQDPSESVENEEGVKDVTVWSVMAEEDVPPAEESSEVAEPDDEVDEDNSPSIASLFGADDDDGDD
jgi:hypothetical protein